MTRIAAHCRLALVGLALAATTPACRTAHLGEDAGTTTRAAIAAQRASHPEAAPTFGAADAHATLAAQRSAKGRADAGAGGAPAGALIMPASGGGGDWQGSKAPIALEAK